MCTKDVSETNLVSATMIVEKYGLPYSAVNYYTIIGLLHVETRRGNKRLYNKEDVRERLLKVAELQNRGYPLRLIRKELEKVGLNKDAMEIDTAPAKRGQRT